MKPWLWMPASVSHSLSPLMLPLVSALGPCKNRKWRSLEWRGLRFDNPMGIAGGVDKKGSGLPSWQKLGAGFLEVGTVTPEAQGPNPGKIMDRDVAREAVWNKMGFPNGGVETLLGNLEKFKKREVPLFINVGKNRWTENKDAAGDYLFCIDKTHKYADAFVVNLSSPNTKNLRDLLDEKYLSGFLEKVVGGAKPICPDKPILLKLSPDMDKEALEKTLQSSFEFVDGWILTNTTKARQEGSTFPVEGGVSGKPLCEASRECLQIAVDILGSRKGDKLLVSAGGISSRAEVEKRLEMGADLVQAYAALIFEGPWFFSKVLGGGQR